MRRSTIMLAAALSFVSPAMAAAEKPEMTQFTHKGVTYAYTVTQRGAIKVLRGTAYDGRVPFTLRVSSKAVSGEFYGHPVAFSLKSVRPVDGIVEIASR
jgi:hypothetical protein